MLNLESFYPPRVTFVDYENLDDYFKVVMAHFSMHCNLYIDYTILRLWEICEMLLPEELDKHVTNLSRLAK